MPLKLNGTGEAKPFAKSAESMITICVRRRGCQSRSAVVCS